MNDYYKDYTTTTAIGYLAMSLCYTIVVDNVAGHFCGLFGAVAAINILINVAHDKKRKKLFDRVVANYVADNNWHYYKTYYTDRYGGDIINLSTNEIVNYDWDFDAKCFKLRDQMYQEWMTKENAKVANEKF